MDDQLVADSNIRYLHDHKEHVLPQIKLNNIVKVI